MDHSYKLTEENVGVILNEIKTFMQSGKMKDKDIDIILRSFKSGLGNWLALPEEHEVKVFFEK